MPRQGRVGSCWNGEGPLTPTHQCGEVPKCFGELNITHQGKHCDDRSVYYNSSSDASDVAQRCPESPKCTNERHNALFREK